VALRMGSRGRLASAPGPSDSSVAPPTSPSGGVPLPRYVQLEVRGHQANAALRWDVPNQTNPRCGWRSGGFYGPSKWRGEKAGATNSNAPTPASVPGKKKPQPGDGRGLCVQRCL
jgi:hypothetical protein